MKAHGAYSVLVSGGFMPFAGPVAEAIGFDKVVANELEIRDGKLTGRVLDPVVDSAAKLETLKAEAAKHGRAEENTSEIQSLMRISKAVFTLTQKNKN